MGNDKGLTYCRREMKGKGKAQRRSDKYCIKCKFKIRTKGHNEGSHHNNRNK